ncbi:hypothetical protein DYU11_21105 [Fibrisoma montanum]|uniref:DUF3592 domain-containing protein n=1 Tax=Fibrisoma montanum TaxID=2305895 RepID=A0A418M3Z7_9BACT|nr:hypothetical protein [Fibrisoma montanum]RIV20546.1 hypothetical protein DYU11_21105 [Fibrisoma montanum]
MDDSGKSIVGIIVLLFIVFVIVESIFGHTRYCPGTVQGHVYNPPYYENKTYHSAEFHLLVYVANPEHVANVETSILNYVKYQDGDQVVVGERCGRWTGRAWVNWIADKNATDY